jgi:hypothetical protein
MGRPRKSIEELKRSGTYRPSRHREREGDKTQPPCETPAGARPGVLHTGEGASGFAPLAPPADLSGPAVRWWLTLTAALADRIVASDVPQLGRACTLLADADQCRLDATKLDATTPEHGRATRSALANAAAADRILSSFGLTPAARAKLPGVHGAGVSDDERARLSAIERKYFPPSTWIYSQVPVRPKSKLDRAQEAWTKAGNKGAAPREFVETFVG